jgi:uncharacterized protein
MRFRVSNVTRQAILADRAERAATFWERLRGLIGRAQLKPGEALHITPCRSIHTFFMRFPIDVVFLDRHGTVLRACPAMSPWSALVCSRATSVLELPPGTAAATGTRTGDVLTFELC